MALGVSTTIVVGNLLGAGKLEEAKDTDRKMIAFSLMCSIGVGLILVILAPIFPKMYNTTDEARQIATYMIMISSMIMPSHAFANAAYFTLRSGGQVFITLLFGSVFMWVVVIPTAFILGNFTSISIYWLYLVCQSLEILKAIFGAILVKRGTWVKTLV